MFGVDDSDSSDDIDDDNSPSENQNVPATVVGQEQWVKAIEFCSCKSKSSDSVSKNIGVEKLCQATDVSFGENDKAELGWILVNNHQEESLIVSFETAVFINEVIVYESLNPGSIVKLEIMEYERKKFSTMWQRKSPPIEQSGTHNILKPALRRYHIPTNTIRLTLDPRYADRVGIQAIKLRGSNIFDVTIDRISLSQSMLKLYQEAINQIHTNVEFHVEDRTIHAHRNILCCRSAYFRALLLNDFMERTQMKPIELTDIDGETFLEILHFIYTGTYSHAITYEIAMKSMIYANKINLLSAKNAAIEQIYCYVRLNHKCILSIYCLIKPRSPAFDLLLDYIYDLCSEHLNDICKQKEFAELKKDDMIDLICQSAARRENREQDKNKQVTVLPESDADSDEDE